MSAAKTRWDTNTDRGADGALRVAGPHGTATIGAVEDSSGGVLLVWTGPRQGPAPLRLVDPLQGDPGHTIAALTGGQRETDR